MERDLSWGNRQGRSRLRASQFAGGSQVGGLWGLKAPLLSSFLSSFACHCVAEAVEHKRTGLARSFGKQHQALIMGFLFHGSLFQAKTMFL